MPVAALTQQPTPPQDSTAHWVSYGGSEAILLAIALLVVADQSPLPTHPMPYRQLFFLPLFLAEFSTISLLTLPPSMRVTARGPWGGIHLCMTRYPSDAHYA
jgi:hypothetical protein